MGAIDMKQWGCGNWDGVVRTPDFPNGRPAAKISVCASAPTIAEDIAWLKPRLQQAPRYFHEQTRDCEATERLIAAYEKLPSREALGQLSSNLEMLLCRARDMHDYYACGLLLDSIRLAGRR